VRTTPFVCSMTTIQHDIYKAIERMISYLDSNSFVSAGIELGRIQELANRLSNTCHHAGDALWEDSQNKK
jgi:hypothetical protein